jgi:ribonuclease HI
MAQDRTAFDGHDELEVYTDGASRGNPGPASYGIVFTDGEKIVYTDSGFLGTATNNQAEYNAVINALDIAIEAGLERIDLHSDSQLMINQLNGEWRVKDDDLSELHEKVKDRLEKVNATFSHLPRENRFIDRADTLCNDTLDREGH